MCFSGFFLSFTDFIASGTTNSSSDLASVGLDEMNIESEKYFLNAKHEYMIVVTIES